MDPELLRIQQALKNLKRLHDIVTFLKRIRHKSKDKSIKEYCTKQIARLTAHAKISKQRFHGGDS